MCLRLQTNARIKGLTTDILSARCFVPQNYNACWLLRDVKAKYMFVRTCDWQRSRCHDATLQIRDKLG